jgi:3',5'-cyclic-AMP phosphodiesterase
MKKYSIILLLIIIAAASSAAGILVAQYKNKNAQKAPVVSSKVEQPSIADTNSAVPVSNQSSEPPAVPAASPAPENLANNNTAFSFAIMGDTKSFSASNPNGNLQKAVASIDKINPNFAFVMGDLVSSCDGGSSCEGKLNSWKSVVGSSLMSKMYPIVGNHDRTGGAKADAMWQKEFNLPTNGPSGFSELTYSFNFGNSHFVVLDSEKPKEHLVDSAQRAWLEQDLSANKKDHIFVFFHEPAYQTSQNQKDGLDANPSERDALWNILVKYNIEAVFNGHEHIHTRKKVGNIYQIVIGDTNSTDDDTPQPGLSDYSYKGKSFGIMSVDGQKVNLKMYTVDGQLLNSFDL